MKAEFEARGYWKKAVPTGVKVDRAGGYYVCVPRLAPGIPATMNRVFLRNGKPMLEAFPSWAWNQPESPMTLHSVQGFEIDESDRIWLLDQGKIAFEPSPSGSQKLLVWDLNVRRMIDVIPIPDEVAPPRTSFLNDLVVDNRNGFVYITDSGQGWLDHPVRGGIIVYDMKKRAFRRVLDRQFSTQNVPGFQFAIDDKPVTLRGGADGIALSADRSTLYYCPLTARNLYAIDTACLRDFRLPPEQIAGAVQAIGSKRTATDGMHADAEGNVYYTMLEGKGIGRYVPGSDTFAELVSDDRMLWVDGVAFDQRGAMLFNSNRLHEIMGGGEIDWTYPYNFVVWKAFIGPGAKSYLYGG
ncbi:major royal jelly family protein [Paenibacillus glycinis]|nr:major royal jelly family protein [Paenibacillus glycinis]